MVNKMIMKIYLFIFLITIPFSCTNGNKKETGHTKNHDSVSLLEDVKEEKQDTAVLRISPDLNLGYPKDEATLKMWQQKVLKDADKYFYKQLLFYYSDNPHLQDEMIKYSEAMIKRHKENGIYILDYYDYVKDSKSTQKNKLMIRAINSLKELLKRNDEVDITLVEVGVTLSELYREGIYVKRDTVIADYLYAGGRNLDSIIQVRKYE
ncbi:MAG: hypothetical protein LBI82_08510 [Dysgonamonadaceae bacterium]|nr:hypothetical protein [Dysgonamonadaceae bacterium]